MPPEVTVERLTPLLPAFGITRVANVTGLDTVGIPVVQVCRPNARSLSVSQGKGLTLAAAKASGIMEAIELHHAERVELPLRRASYREMQLEARLVHVAGLLHVPNSLFHDDRRLLWVPGFDVLRKTTVWLPHESVHMDFVVPLPGGSGCFFMSSNGLASGNHPLEALCHSLCELIERDALAQWLKLDQATRELTRIDPASIGDGACQRLLERFTRTQIEVALWDITSPFQVAAVHCLVREAPSSTWRRVDPATGTGCHPDKYIALQRALTEAAQSRLTGIAGSRDDLVGPSQDPGGHRRRGATAGPFPGNESPKRSLTDMPHHPEDCLVAEANWLVERLAQGGSREVVVVDLSRPGLDLAVVKTVVPGLGGIR